MEEERKSGKEYYQLNLDTGRIFWIAFLLGLILIGIFFFGFYAGSGKIKETLLGLGMNKTPVKEEVESEKVAPEEKEEPSLVDVLRKDLQEEVKYIDVKDLEKVGEEKKVVPEKPSLPRTIVEDKYEKVPVPAKPSPVKPRTYVPRGTYYIQVASFTDKENAESFAKILRKNMYKVNIEKAQVEDKTFYRVRVGPFEQKSVATNTMTAMKRIFNLSDPFVVQKDP